MSRAILRIDGEYLAERLCLPADCIVRGTDGRPVAGVMVEHPSIPEGCNEVSAWFRRRDDGTIDFLKFEPVHRPSEPKQ